MASFYDFLQRLGMHEPTNVWVLSLLTFIGAYVVLRMLVWVAVRAVGSIARRSSSKVDDIIIDFLHSVHGGVWVSIALLVALRLPAFPDLFETIIDGSLVVILVVQTIFLLQRVLEYLFVQHLPDAPQDAAELPAVLRVSLMLVLWIFGVLLILSNLGINVVSLVAGLGIGGIAIALAVQNILGDIFSSYSLYFDKPFKEGDFIIVGQHMGTVKKIGLKTTRLESLDGEEIVISNQELTSTRVRNYKRMHQRRVVLHFGVLYDTPPAMMRKIPTMVREVIEATENVRFDRAHFKQFGDSSLDFEVVYYMLNSNYNAYMDAQEQINLAIMERFAQHAIGFAFPTRTVHLVKE